MLKTLVLLLALIITSCGPLEAKGKGWSAEFNPYVSAFQMEVEGHNRKINPSYMTSLTIEFGDAAAACDKPDAVGCCLIKEFDGARTVTVSRRYWDTVGIGYGEGRRYEVIFHELGHCLLDFQHRGVEDPSTGYPNSLMYKTSFNGDWFQAHLNTYMDEFFSQ